MKTKHLLMTLALPAVFAACSNEDFVEQSTISTVNDGRKVVGEVVLKTTVGLNEPTTRVDWGINGNEVIGRLESTDAIGAAQIDTYNPDRFPYFFLSDETNTNIKFWLESENGDYTWKSQSPLSEGNYLFYLNYDPQMLNRKGMYDIVNPVQSAQDEEGFDKYNALDDQFYLGYKFLEAGENEKMVNEIDLRISPVHSMIGIKANYINGAQPVKIKKIAIRKAEGSLTPEEFVKGFVTNIANGSMTYAPMTTRVDIKPKTTHERFGFLDPACMANGVFQLKENKNPNITDEQHYDNVMASLVYPNWEKEYLTYQYEVNFPECDETTLESGESVSGFILMPTCNFSRSTNKWDEEAMAETANMVVAIYTDKGVVEVPMYNDYVDANVGVLGTSVTGDLTALKPGQISYFEVTFDGTAAYNAPKTFTVNNTEDLKEHLSYFEGTTAKAELHLYSAGERVEMDQEIYDLLAKKSNLELTLESGQLVIANGLTLKDGKSPLDLIHLDKAYRNVWDELIKHIFEMNIPAPTIVVEGSYEIAGMNYTSTSGETLGNDIQEFLQKDAPNFGITVYSNDALPLIKVAEGGQLTVNKSVNVRIENEGTLNVAADANVLSVINSGVTNIDANFAAFQVFNAATGEIKINKGTSYFALYNDRDFKVTENCCLNDEEAFKWTWGKVEIAKDVNVYLYGLEYKGMDQFWYGNWGEIENNGTIRQAHPSNDFVGEPQEVIYCINHGRIINNGVIYDLFNDGYVDNNGTLTNIAYTTEWSYIDITDSQKISGPNDENNHGGEIVYQVAAANAKLELPEVVTTLVVSDEVVLAAENKTVTNIILKDGANLSGKFTNKALRVLVEEGASATLSGESYAGKLFISPSAKLTIAKNTELTNITILKSAILNVVYEATMTYNGNIQNHGQVDVDGTAVAGNDGTYNEFTGGEWSGNNEPRPLVSYSTFKTTLKTHVEKYINTFTSAKVDPTFTGFASTCDDIATLKEMALQLDGGDGANAMAYLKSEFEKLLPELQTEYKDKLIKAFEGKTSTWTDSKVYDNATAAYDNFRSKLLTGEVEGSIDPLYRYAATELTDEEVAAILEDYAPYRYVWKGNELDEVLSVMANGWGEWMEVFGTEGGYTLNTMEGVKKFLTDASKYQGNTEYGLDARNVANKYLSEFKDWNYSNEQVAAFGYNEDNKQTNN